MEEILASIRRIIADDQTLQGAIAREQSAPVPPAPPVEPHAPVPVQAPEPDPPHHEPSALDDSQPIDDLGADERLAPSATVEHAHAFGDRPEIVQQHGSIAAPQFAMPHGPADDLRAFEEDRMESLHSNPFSQAAEPAHQPEPEPFVAPVSHHPESLRDSVPAPASHSAEFEDAQDAEHDDGSYDAPIDPGHADHADEAPALFSEATDTSLTSAFQMLAATRLADNTDELRSMVREMIRPLLRSWLDDNLPSMVEKMVRAEIERVARGGR